MSKQQKLILLVAVLVMANIWRWYITGEPAEETRANSEVVTPEELLVHASVAGEAGSSHAMRGDLFQVKVSPREKIIKPIAKPVSKTLVPEKTPLQLEQEAIQTDMLRVRYLGVVVRKGRAQAYLAQGTETYLVYAGDMVAHRYKVERVTLEAIELFDQKVNIRQTIPLTGK